MRIRVPQRYQLGAPSSRRRTRRSRPSLAARLWIEPLESRSLLAISTPIAVAGSQIEVEPNDTLDVAQDLGNLSTRPGTAVLGTVGNGPTAAADVDWYRFTLDGPAHVSLVLGPRGDHPLTGILSLYNDDPFDFVDQYDPLGHRLLVQQAGASGGAAQIERDLGPGSYEVAVSGAGNRDFHPFLAGSGFAGATGDYLLQLGADDLPFSTTDGPAVLTSDPAPGAVLDRSPLVIRLDFGSTLDPATVIPDQTVRLTYNPGGHFGDGNDQDIPFAWTNVGVGGTELQLAPAAPLAPGSYRITLAGDSTGAAPVLADLGGIPLGVNETNPQGRDYIATFVVNGIEGNTGPDAVADDTLAGAHDLGTLTSAVLTSVSGAIGDDPYYNYFDPALNPGNDVDLYHFHISGPGRYAFLAEVFAGRIGSPFDAGVSLYRLDPDDHLLHFLAGNNNTANTATATDFSNPLYLDSMITLGLTEGDYYVAVAGGFNTPSPDEFQAIDTPGLFDPNLSHSGQNGFSTGPYTLNLLVYPAPDPPRVVSSSVSEGMALDQSPNQLTIGFSDPVNLQLLGFRQYLETSDGAISSVSIEGADGTIYYPRLDHYDPTTNQVTLSMLDRLPAGSYTLRLSGSDGLTDLGGNPLAGNDPSGDYVIHFTVAATSPVRADDSGQGYVIDAQPGPDSSQDLGVLFPSELEAGITLDHSSASDAGQAADGTGQEYRFTLLQDQRYLVTLDGSNLPAGAGITLQDDAGNPVVLGFRAADTTLLGRLAPGSYVLKVTGMASDTAYQLNIRLLGGAGNPVPLLSGPAPGLLLHFNVIAPIETPGETSSPGGDSTGGSTGSIGGSTGSIGGSTGSIGGNTGSTGGNTGSTGGGSGVPIVFAGPSPFHPSNPTGTGSPSQGSNQGGGIAAVTEVPTPFNPGPTLNGTGGGLASSAITVTTAAVGREAKVASNAVAASLYPTDFAPLAISPVGGVTGTVDVSGVTQVIQVGLQIQASPQVPMGLVSLVTLTRTGEIGNSDEFQPNEPVGESIPDAAAAEATPTADAIPPVDVAAQAPSDPTSHLETALRRIAAWWTGSPAPPPAVAVAAAGAGDVLSQDVNGANGSIVAAEDSGSAMTEEVGDGEVGALAFTPRLWCFILAALVVVTVSARRRRLARRMLAGYRGDGGHDTRSPFRLWGLHAARGPSLATRVGRQRGAATALLHSCARPRHLTNP